VIAVTAGPRLDPRLCAANDAHETAAGRVCDGHSTSQGG